MNLYHKFRLLRSSYKFAIYLITAITISIPAMYQTFLSNIENEKNHYGSYTSEEFQELNINDPIIDKIKNQKDFYNSYFTKEFYDVKVEESISYLKTGISANYLIHLGHNEKDSVSYTVQIWTDTNNKITRMHIHFTTTYTGDSIKALSIVDEEEINHICKYFDIQNTYSTLEKMCSKIDEKSPSAYIKDDNNVEYRVYITDHYNPNINAKIAEYTIEKTY